jgi:hypothetical protein
MKVEKSHSGSYLQMGRSFASLKLQTYQFNLSGLQANGTRYSIYLRKVRIEKNWLFEGQHGFRPVYSCENRVITVCQDSADSLYSGVRTDAKIIYFSKTFDLVPPRSAAYENFDVGSGLEGSCIHKRIISAPYTREKRRAIIGVSQSNVRSTARKCTSSTTVPRVRKLYLEKY